MEVNLIHHFITNIRNRLSLVAHVLAELVFYSILVVACFLFFTFAYLYLYWTMSVNREILMKMKKDDDEELFLWYG